MVPTCTMLGRFTPTCGCGVSARKRSPRAPLLPYVVKCAPGGARPRGVGRSGRAAARAPVRSRPRRTGSASTVRRSRPSFARRPAARDDIRRHDDGDAHGQHARPRRERRPQQPACPVRAGLQPRRRRPRRRPAGGRPPPGAGRARGRLDRVRDRGRRARRRRRRRHRRLVLDGEAQPAGGMGMCRQLKDEIHRCPPVLVLIGRAGPTAGSPTGRGPTPRCRSRSTRSPRPTSSPSCCAPHRGSAPVRPPLTGPVTRRRRPTWPGLLDRAARRRGPDRATTTAGRCAGDDRRGHPRADRGLRWWRCGPRARRPRGRRAWPTTMLEQADAGRAARAAASTSSAPAATARTRSTSPRWPRSSPPAAGRAGGQARQPGGVVGVRRRRRPRGAGRGDRPAGRSGWPQLAGEVGHRLLLRAAVPPGVPARRRWPRRELGIATVFNFLGPLTNPARPGGRGGRLSPTPAWRRSWPGCWPRAGHPALVFRGDDGLDELTTATTSAVWVVRDGEVRRAARPRRPRHARGRPPDACAAATRRTTPSVVRAVLAGEQGPVRDAVLLNAAAALVAFDEPRARGCTTRCAGLDAGCGRAATPAAAGASTTAGGRAALDRWVAAAQPTGARAGAGAAQSPSKPIEKAASRSCRE